MSSIKPKHSKRHSGVHSQRHSGVHSKSTQDWKPSGFSGSSAKPMQMRQQAGVTGQAVMRHIEGQATRPNNTGLPDQLKAGVENLSGLSMDDVKVHYNSPKPMQFKALACVGRRAV